jgi:hypothetical protein
MNKFLVSSTALILCAGSGIALAGDDDHDGYDDMTGEAVAPDDSTDTTAHTTDDGGMSGDGNGAVAGGGGGDAYKMGISVPLIGSDFSVLAGALGGDLGISTANLLWAMGKNWLDLGIGFSVQTVAADPGPPIVDKRTAVGFELDAGYRMMKPTKGRVMPFLKPFLQFGVKDFDSAGDHIILGAGATLGVDVLVFDQFTLGAQIGAALRTDDTFNSMSITTGTSSLNATIWW